MADTFSQIYLHIVFAVRSREHLIKPSFSEELQKYITGIVKSHNCKILAIKAMTDHVHMFISYVPGSSVADMVRDVKAYSSEFIKKNWSNGFSWQQGYGVFSHSRSQINQVIQYIQNQEEHHRHKSFREEYMKILRDFAVEMGNKEAFEWIKDGENK
ncbi:MAG: IS200/IS605 family transposase [Ignavibacteria bacterium]|jgi:REP element-mobilizing transposase RayT|nr:IS200/IS605 family transposase [Ignavibacteria bacterium]MCU7504357.1 IS200/IS605 family transposase [Ignavibacteria bacterium]MCU7517580.1 IS200/IS605 family transposase [Ignavibacteria bacterium]